MASCMISQNVRRTLTVIFAMLTIAMVPAAWIIARDMWNLLTAKRQEESDIHGVITGAMVDAVERHEAIEDAGVFRIHSMVFDPACVTYYAHVQSALPVIENDPDDLDSGLTMNQRMDMVDWLALASARQAFDRRTAYYQFSDIEASVLHACIAATPAAGLCIERYHERAHIYNAGLQRTQVKLGVRRRTTNGHLCRTIPDFVDS